MILAATLGTDAAAEQFVVVWTKNNIGDKAEVIVDDKGTGRFANFFSFHAVQKQTNGSAYDGIVNKGSGTCDLVQGRGHCSGFDVNEKDGDMWRAGWAGECYPLTGKDGKPVVHCAGGFSIVPGSGTGRFAGLSGGGTWKGHALENGEFFVEATGTFEK